MPKIIKTYGPLATDFGGSFYVRPVYVFVDNEGADGTDPDDDCPCQVSMPGSAFGAITSRPCGYGGLGRGGSSLTVNTTNIYNNPYSGDPVVPGTVGTAFRAVPTNTATAINAGPCDWGGPAGGWLGSFAYVWPENPTTSSTGPSKYEFAIDNTPVVDIVLFNQEIYGGFTNSLYKIMPLLPVHL